jgi:hypothetical protein
VVSTSRNNGQFPVNANHGSALDLAGPLNITSAVPWWSIIVTGASQVLAPIGKLSILHPSVVGSELASMRLAYYGEFESFPIITVDTDPLGIQKTANTPAADYWTLYVLYVLQNATVPYSEIAIPIVFLPTGEIDVTRTKASDYLLANNILRPTITLLQAAVGANFDIWKLLNWLFISFYWTILADLGQVAPTTYDLAGFIEGSPVGVANTSQPQTSFPATNNIFVNETLFNIYQSYLRDTLLPLYPGFSVPSFNSPSSRNQLQPVETAFIRSYSCLERQWKGVLSAIISVIVADYALFFGPYHFYMWLAGWLRKRRDNDGIFSIYEKT